MKVIVAGMPKTGTKSMQEALKLLGYTVYDFTENYWYLGKQWEKICTEGGATEDFRKMYENVDAVTDMPPCSFWEEIHKAFPDSKIILTMRDNEDTWAKSLETQINIETQPMLLIMKYLSPTMFRMFRLGDLCGMVGFGCVAKGSFFHKPRFNYLLARMAYRSHNSHVMQAAPKDKLLVFNVKEGWDPLCKFLGVNRPDKPFPRKNVGGNIIDEYMETDPVMQRVKREMTISVSVLAVALGYGSYKLWKLSAYSYVCAALSRLAKTLFAT